MVATNEIAGPVADIVNSIEERAAREQRKPLGTIVRVTCPKEIDTVSFSDAFIASGFSENDLQGVHARGALGRAVRSLKSGHEVICDSDTETSLTYALTERKSDDSLVRRDVQRVTYDRAKKTLSFATEFAVAEIQAAFAKYQVVLQRDKTQGSVRDALASALAVPCLGGQFVPASSAGAVASAKSLVARLKAAGHADVRFEAVTFYDEPENKETVAASAADHFTGELLALEKQLSEDVEASEKGERKVKVSTFLARQKAALVIQERALAYKEAVEIDASDIQARVAALIARVGELENKVSPD